MRLPHIIIYLFCLTLLSCESKINTDELYQSLRDNEAKVVIKMDNRNFYPQESFFKGEFTIYQNSLQINLTDQYDGNIILALSGEKWFAQKPIKKTVSIDNQVAASVMIGKVNDKVKRTGDGYLMSDGEISIETITKEKCIIHLKGKIAKYEYMRVPQKWNRLEGVIVFKTPKIVWQNVPEQEVFY